MYKEDITFRKVKEMDMPNDISIFSNKSKGTTTKKGLLLKTHWKK